VHGELPHANRRPEESVDVVFAWVAQGRLIVRSSFAAQRSAPAPIEPRSATLAETCR
jgi:hypothetical protein